MGDNSQGGEVGSNSEQLRREAQELRAKAQRLVEEAAQLLARSSELESKISSRTPKPRVRVIPLKDVPVPKAPK